MLSEGSQLQPYDFPAISGLSPPTGSAPAAAAQADLQPIGDGPHPPSTDSPVRILDEEGHVRALDAIEGDLIRLAIERYEGHMSEIARRLGIGRSTLYRKVRENGLGDMAGLDGG